MISARLNLTHPLNKRHPLNVGRVAWWLSLPQWGFGGNTWHDLCRRNNGTLTNGPTWLATTRPGGWGALGFDGTDDDVVVTSSAAINLSGDMTLAAWVYLAATPSGVNFGIVGKGTGGSGQPYSINSANGSRFLSWRSFDGSTHTINGNAIPLNQWQRVLATRVGTSVVLYQDAVATGSGTGGGNSNSSNVTIGGLNDGSDFYFNGRIDDVSLWNRALSASEVALDYDLSRRGYPGVLNRVRPVVYSAGSQPPPPSGGSLVCATVGLAARVDATVNVASRVNATVSLSPRVNATADVQEC